MIAEEVQSKLPFKHETQVRITKHLQLKAEYGHLSMGVRFNIRYNAVKTISQGQSQAGQHLVEIEAGQPLELSPGK